MPLESTADGRLPESDLLAAIVDTAGSVILGLDPLHRIVAWNRAAEQLYQTPRASALGMDYVATFIAPDHRDAVAADIQEVLAGKRTMNFEDDSVLPDGSRRTLIWNVTRVVGADGAPVGIVATGQDITQRTEAEERFRVIFEHALDGLLLSDASGVIDCNPAALRHLGLDDKAQLIGRRPAEFSPPFQPDGTPSDEKSRTLGRTTLAQGTHTFDWMHQRPDGTLVPLEVSVRHAMMNGRRVSVVVWRDQQRRLELDRERQVVEQRINVAQKLEAVGQLAGGMAHDFNNLLAAIRNSIQLAVNELPPGVGIHGDLMAALQSTERAARLTGQLLSFSRRQEPSCEAVDLVALLRDMLPLLRTWLPATITITLEGTTSGVVHADRSQMEQLVLNLVLNARDAMPDGGVLALAVHTDETSLHFDVSDTGVGMTDAVRAHVFEPFFTTKPVGSGTGLGLAVVYGVVTAAAGTVRIDSSPGAGTTVHVTLPRLSGDVIAAVPEPVASPEPVPPPGGLILLVDDDTAVRTTTRRLLRHHGFEVLEATTGDAAVQLFSESRDRLLAMLTDIRMPGMDGVQLARTVRRQAPGFPIVFITGYSDADTDHGTDLAGIPLLAKPFSSARLLEVLRLAAASSPSVP